ncbi:MAG: hypothetical protein E7356_04655 [Clostridiales bacterium]|nr:hypothetical protein [Clostridiales bacterium]
MSKNVLNYLSKQQRKERRDQSISDLKEFMISHAKEIKDYAVRTGCTLMSAAILLFLASCEMQIVDNPSDTTDTYMSQPHDSGVSDITSPYYQFETRPSEEIEKTNATVEDVLGHFDALFENLVKAKYGNIDTINQIGKDNYDKIDASLGYITGTMYEDEYVEGYGPIYSAYEFLPLTKSHNVNHEWFNDSTNPYYTNADLNLENVYLITLHGNSYSVLGEHKYDKFVNLAVPAEVMEEVLNAFNVEKYTLTPETIATLKYPETAEHFMGQEVYKFRRLDTGSILSANQEQLNALFKLIKAVDQINVQGINPTNDITPER